ncbi:MAG: VacJ family lipoprotein [Nitrospiraceae bacterium]
MGCRRWREALLWLVLISLSGCADHIELLQASHASSFHLSSVLPTAEQERIPVSMAAAAEPVMAGSQTPPPSPQSAQSGTTDLPDDLAGDEPFDPFASPQDVVEEYDPWEPLNVFMFEVNRKIDTYALKPIARAYNAVLPNDVQRGVQNFFHNARTGPRFFNNLFQGKLRGAGIELGRFALNTTFGLGGFFDVAKHMRIETPDEDFGQTLGYYNVPQGPYLVIPLFPPFTVRDFTGYLMDLALDPINWLVFPIIEINNVPSLVAHQNRMTTTIVQLGSRATFIVNERSRNLETFEGVEESTIDLYSAVRNAYLQKRVKLVRE